MDDVYRDLGYEQNYPEQQKPPLKVIPKPKPPEAGPTVESEKVGAEANPKPDEDKIASEEGKKTSKITAFVKDNKKAITIAGAVAALLIVIFVVLKITRNV
jgi:hypothetical protein